MMNAEITWSDWSPGSSNENQEGEFRFSNRK